MKSKSDILRFLIQDSGTDDIDAELCKLRRRTILDDHIPLFEKAMKACVFEQDKTRELGRWVASGRY